MTPQSAVARLKSIDREIQLLEHTTAILGWDEQTYMPPRATAWRAEQLSHLQGLIHARVTAPEIGELLADAGATDANPRGDAALPELDRSFLRAMFRKHSHQTRLPASLVTELSRETSVGFSIWREARAKSRFADFAPQLAKLVSLVVRKAECLGYTEHPYDALLDEYEPWMKTAHVKAVFDELGKRLSAFAARIRERPQVDDAFLLRVFPVEQQDAFARKVLRAMSFEEERGRLDLSPHPFTTTLGTDDIRITTKWVPDFMKAGLFGVIHECGHALYELGIAEPLRGTILGTGTSMGIHESQSRMWENMIGRSRDFWTAFFPELSRLFPTQLHGIDVDRFYRAVNRVEPSLIRIEADEVTYGLHIILRFQLELALVTGDLKAADLSEAWNAKMQELLGVRPDSDANGVLQDIHWSGASIGYFPTYALGNLYAAQFFARMHAEIGDVETEIAKGNLRPVLDWLRQKIHIHGSALSADELCEQVTGERLNPAFFLRYLEDKFTPIYGL